MNTAGLFALLLVGSHHASADVPVATVTSISAQATHSGAPAVTGTVLHNGEFLKTAKGSFAEMVLANKTVTRLGPNTAVSYSAVSREAQLQSGTVLFSKPKDGEAMTFQMAGVTAAVTGTTGFVERTGDSVYLGVIEGTVHVTVGTAKAILHAGNMLVASGNAGQVVSFDVPHFVSTSAFFHNFRSALPNAKSVEHEIASYQNMVARGFIAPATTVTPPSTAEHHDSVAAIRSNGHEMASSAMTTTLAGGRSFGAGARGISLASSGSGSSGLTISGSGVSTVGGGILTVGNGNGYSGGTTLGGNGTISINGGGSSGTSSGVITIAGGGNAGTISGSSGTGVISDGTGTTVLGGGNTYSGGTISGGTLGGSGTISTGGGLTVTTGGTLGGTGTISTGGGTITGTTGTLTQGTPPSGTH